LHPCTMLVFILTNTTVSCNDWDLQVLHPYYSLGAPSMQTWRSCSFLKMWELHLSTVDDNFRMNTGMVDTAPLIIWLL
jgi:hypothetical protein